MKITIKMFVVALSISVIFSIVTIEAANRMDRLVEKTDVLIGDYNGGDDGFNRLFVEDLDNDGIKEIITVGHVSPMGAGTDRDVYIGVYSMTDFKEPSLVKKSQYIKDFNDGNDGLNSLVVFDYDDDGVNEIFVTGYATEAYNSTSEEDIIVGVFRMENDNIIKEVDWYIKDFDIGAPIQKNFGRDIAVGDVDDDGEVELVVVSSDDFGTTDALMRIGVLNITAGTVNEETWFSEDPTDRNDWWNAVEIGDIDDDDTNEIVVTGTYYEFWSYVCVAAYNITEGSVMRECPFYMIKPGVQNHHGNDLAIGNVDDDDDKEIVVVGNFDDGDYGPDNANFALGVLNYSGSTFTEDVPWLNLDMGRACFGHSATGTDAATSTFIHDVDNDGTEEIIVGGYATGSCTDYDMLVGVFGVSEGNMAREFEWFWKDNEGGRDTGTRVFVDDLDDDGFIEIVLSGNEQDLQNPVLTVLVPQFSLRKLSVELTGEFDYLQNEPVEISLAALVKDASTMMPISDADVVVTLYVGASEYSFPMQEVGDSGIYEWKSPGTIGDLGVPKGIYLVQAEASYMNGPKAYDVLQFHIDPPPEENNPLPMQVAIASITSAAVTMLILKGRSIIQKIRRPKQK